MRLFFKLYRTFSATTTNSSQNSLNPYRKLFDVSVNCSITTLQNILFISLFLTTFSALAGGALENLDVIGTVNKENKQNSYAVIQLKYEDPKAYHIGDEIRPGVLLEQILNDRIRIRNGSSISEIKLGSRFAPGDSFNAKQTVHTTDAYIQQEYGPATIVPDHPEPPDLGVILIPDPSGQGVIEPEPISSEIDLSPSD
jgi:hypothetical protein